MTDNNFAQQMLRKSPTDYHAKLKRLADFHKTSKAAMLETLIDMAIEALDAQESKK